MQWSKARAFFRHDMEINEFFRFSGGDRDTDQGIRLIEAVRGCEGFSPLGYW